MAKNYSQRLPVDRDDNLMPFSTPPFTANAVLARENASTSSTIGLNPNTTVVQVTTTGAPAAIKWGTSVIGVSMAAGTANYDVTVPANESRLFVVPRFQQAVPNYSAIQNPSVVGMNRSEGLYTHMATISGGISSVFLAEY